MELVLFGCCNTMIYQNEKNIIKTEFGDWQTPLELAQRICLLISKQITPDLIVEPNCGIGAFLQAAINIFPHARRILGLDINPDYVQAARSMRNNGNLEVIQGDFFAYDWKCLNEFKGPVLILGNPPWVTNAELMRIKSSNIPMKANFNGLNGMEAITGKSNFDISEWMLIKETELLQDKEALLSMLCKTTVARKVLSYVWKNTLRFSTAEMRLINARQYFGVAVDACLLLIRFQPGLDRENNVCEIFNSLEDEYPSSTLGFYRGQLVSQIDRVNKYADFIATKPSLFCWRSGIKHDCSKVMELKKLPDGYFINGFNELVEIEKDLLFPMHKSSDLANGRENISKYMLVPQCVVGSDTKFIASVYPKMWKYLLLHEELFDKRKSSIYSGKPKFSIFGVGDYTFLPWKVAISGLYKNLNFRIIGPYEGKPVVFDDTCYFLSFKFKEEAVMIKDILESNICFEIFKMLIFWDSKRPVTKDVLNSLNLPAISQFLGREKEFKERFPAFFEHQQLPLLESL